MKPVIAVQAVTLLIVAMTMIEMGESTVSMGVDRKLIRRLGCGTGNTCAVPSSCCCKESHGDNNCKAAETG
jgi:hypothetical protein